MLLRGFAAHKLLVQCINFKVAVSYYMYECMDPWHSVNECIHPYMYLSSQVDALCEGSRAECHESMHSYM